MNTNTAKQDDLLSRKFDNPEKGKPALRIIEGGLSDNPEANKAAEEYRQSIREIINRIPVFEAGDPNINLADYLEPEQGEELQATGTEG